MDEHLPEGWQVARAISYLDAVYNRSRVSIRSLTLMMILPAWLTGQPYR